MSADLLARLPGTTPWLRAIVTPRVEHRVRRMLRRLERAADARVAVLWCSQGRDDEVIAFSGDYSAVPKPFPYLRATVPTYDDFLLECGERATAVVHVVQLGKGLPMLRLAAIAPGPVQSTTLFEAIEDCADGIEEIVVAAM